MASGLRSFLQTPISSRSRPRLPQNRQLPFPAWHILLPDTPTRTKTVGARGSDSRAPARRPMSAVWFSFYYRWSSALTELPLFRKCASKTCNRESRAGHLRCAIEAMNTVPASFRLSAGRWHCRPPTKVRLAVTTSLLARTCPRFRRTFRSSTIADTIDKITHGCARKFPDVLVRLSDAGENAESRAGDPPFRRCAFSTFAGMHDLFHAAHWCSEARGLRHVLRQFHRRLPVEKGR